MRVIALSIHVCMSADTVVDVWASVADVLDGHAEIKDVLESVARSNRAKAEKYAAERKMLQQEVAELKAERDRDREQFATEKHSFQQVIQSAERAVETKLREMQTSASEKDKEVCVDCVLLQAFACMQIAPHVCRSSGCVIALPNWTGICCWPERSNKQRWNKHPRSNTAAGNLTTSYMR